MIEASSVPPRKSPKIVRKRSPYLRNNFAKSSEFFGKWSEIFRKSSKTSSLVCLCNKQNITCPLVDMNLSSCSTRHLTSELRSLVRYRVEHSKIKFISTRGHVISSISAFGFPALFRVFTSRTDRCSAIRKMFYLVCCKFDVLSGRYSLLSKQNTGMSKTTTRIFIPHERSNSTQDFSTSTR